MTSGIDDGRRSVRRETRTVILGLGAIAAIVLLGRVLPASVSWSHERRLEALELQREWARVSSDLQSYPTTRDSAQARRLRLGDEFTSLLHGATTATTEASLVEELREAARTAGVRLGTIDVHTDTSHSSFYAHPRAAVDASGDVRGLSAFLAQLEGNETRIRVLTMTISQSDPLAEPKRPETLQLSVLVEGLGRRPPSKRRQGPSGDPT